MQISDAGNVGSLPWIALYALDTASRLLGCNHAWVTRHHADTCKIMLRLNADMELEPPLVSLLELASKSVPEDNIMLMPWKQRSLLFAGLYAGSAADPSWYVLGMLFEKSYEMTERRSGIMDGLRCCLKNYFSRMPTSYEQPASFPSTPMVANQPVTCCCCRKVHTPQHGWMHWDDLRLMTTGQGSSHTVCEKCADELYSDVLQNGL
ncbi:hypothetical protein [Prosthecobacter vanneervenii]|uniref:Uncharacterized protein n=1 Tax=Prosthecobacter vanneervenii TaxID=48466 RepID=A0A7W7Y8G5_9BACT|nr:hypothetical protein [Prosthecobacter vanneervenii]MBB5031541.1 hypothetical protein [Prosthecobacter vanneervenii]